MKIDSTYNVELIAQPGAVLSDTEVERIIDRTMDELIHLGFENAVISGSVDRRTFELFIPWEEPTFLEIVQRIDSAVRSAFHAAGVATPEWPVDQSPVRMERREVTFKDPDIDEHLTPV